LKPKFSIFNLTGCSGCISTLISLDVFPQFLERTEILYFSFINDVKKIENCDVALVEGCVSEKSEINFLKNIRKCAKKVYALGSCAAFGGILNLSEKINAEPISNFIEIDGLIPGCPPPSKLLGNCLIKLIENKEIELSERNMCATCPFNETLDIDFKTQVIKYYPSPDEILTLDETSDCFLKRGILCLGPITRDGCEQKCITQGIPCDGCMGPVSKDNFANMVNYLSLIKLSDELRNYRGIFYRFSKPKLNW
jgi:coenzyme F420-reducing hydrogenase gamma subunit